MKIIATPEVVEFIRLNGGEIFVWPVTMEYGYARGSVFVLEASVESPGAERGFVRFEGEGITVFYEPGERGTPDSLHLILRGRSRKRVGAYWNGHSYGTE